jgi:hypothetical protein
MHKGPLAAILSVCLCLRAPAFSLCDGKLGEIFKYYTGGAVDQAILIAFFDETPPPISLSQACQ